jgi:hypothetical protein
VRHRQPAGTPLPRGRRPALCRPPPPPRAAWPRWRSWWRGVLTMSARPRETAVGASSPVSCEIARPARSPRRWPQRPPLRARRGRAAASSIGSDRSARARTTAAATVLLSAPVASRQAGPAADRVWREGRARRRHGRRRRRCGYRRRRRFGGRRGGDLLAREQATASARTAVSSPPRGPTGAARMSAVRIPCATGAGSGVPVSTGNAGRRPAVALVVPRTTGTRRCARRPRREAPARARSRGIPRSLRRVRRSLPWARRRTGRSLPAGTKGPHGGSRHAGALPPARPLVRLPGAKSPAETRRTTRWPPRRPPPRVSSPAACRQ